jgi:predicted Zn finger-like uncharacterized protein
MVIKCRRCSKRFNLDESLLGLEGSKVKCTKCGTIFPSFPLPAESEKHPPEKKAEIKPAENDSCSLPAAVQDRLHNRIGISVPVRCVSLASDGKPLDPFLGQITEVSQAGVTIELCGDSISGLVLLSFLNHEGKDIQLKGRVVHSVQKKSGKLRLGVSLLGTAQGVCHFVANLVRAYHLKRKRL